MHMKLLAIQVDRPFKEFYGHCGDSTLKWRQILHIATQQSRFANACFSNHHDCTFKCTQGLLLIIEDLTEVWLEIKDILI